MERTRKMLMGLAGTALMMAAGAAYAAVPARPYSIQVAPGVGGEEITYTNGRPVPNKNSGPGVEQPQTSWLMKNGNVHLMTIWMSSDVADRNNDNNAWQCKGRVMTARSLAHVGRSLRGHDS